MRNFMASGIRWRTLSEQVRGQSGKHLTTTHSKVYVQNGSLGKGIRSDCDKQADGGRGRVVEACCRLAASAPGDLQGDLQGDFILRCVVRA